MCCDLQRELPTYHTYRDPTDSALQNFRAQFTFGWGVVLFLFWINVIKVNSPNGRSQQTLLHQLVEVQADHDEGDAALTLHAHTDTHINFYICSCSHYKNKGIGCLVGLKTKHQCTYSALHLWGLHWTILFCWSSFAHFTEHIWTCHDSLPNK